MLRQQAEPRARRYTGGLIAGHRARHLHIGPVGLSGTHRIRSSSTTAASGTTVASVAVVWTLAWPEVTGAIVGARRPEQVDGWLDAARLDLSTADLDEIALAIERTGAGTGPMHADRARSLA